MLSMKYFRINVNTIIEQGIAKQGEATWMPSKAYNLGYIVCNDYIVMVTFIESNQLSNKSYKACFNSS